MIVEKMAVSSFAREKCTSFADRITVSYNKMRRNI